MRCKQQQKLSELSYEIFKMSDRSYIPNKVYDGIFRSDSFVSFINNEALFGAKFTISRIDDGETISFPHMYYDYLPLSFKAVGPQRLSLKPFAKEIKYYG